MNEMPAARRHSNNQHFLQLFDSTDSLAHAVAAFVREGLLNQEISLLAVTMDHRHAIADCLSLTGIDPTRAEADGQLVFRDAAECLRLFERFGRLDPLLFDSTIGTEIRRLTSRGRVRVYGEIVDLLAVQGDFAGARHLEDLWNNLQRRTPFTLFCGYASENFGDPLSASSLRSICRTHSHSTANASDLLGSFLLRTHVEA
jgi:hypothetical protein